MDDLTAEADRLRPPPLLRALGSVALGIVVALLATVAFTNAYWAVKDDGGLFDIWPLIALVDIALVATVAGYAYRRVGPARRPIPAWVVALAVLMIMAGVVAFGAWTAFR